ncbi:MAG TPA: isoprenylcysteine carboxylmethyltransferase family protein [Thermoanaerobaculia bacterium]
MLANLYAPLIVLWLVAEVALVVFRQAGAPEARLERGAVAVIWIVLAASALATLAASYLDVLRLPLSPAALSWTANAAILAGLAVRTAAVLVLGRFFSVHVTIRDDHEIVDAGPYRWVRHPAYAGILISFVGLGLASGSWLGLALATVPPALVVLERIRVEEAALEVALGESWHAYCARTRRLVPGVY